MKHYIVICEFSVDGESGIDIIGVRHSESEAVALYKKQLPIEFENAVNNGYEKFEESETKFSAYNDGEYLLNHITLYIEQSEG